MSLDKLNQTPNAMDQSSQPVLEEILARFAKESTPVRFTTATPTASDVQTGEVVIEDDDAGTESVSLKTGKGNLITLRNLPAGVQGDILYHNGSGWVVLGAGTSGQYLQTQGPGANPVWAA